MALNSTEVQGGAKLLKFVPPKEEAKNLPRWASYVVGGGMKTHSGVAWAKLSFNNRGWTRVVNPDYNEETDKYWQKYKTVTKHAFILENVDGEWYVLYEVPAGASKDELPWKKKYYYDTKYTWDTRWYRVDEASSYTLKDMESEPDRFKYEYRVTPMTRDEYVAWRLAVERERLGITQ